MSLINYFKDVTLDNKWSGTPMEKYAALGPKQKGAYSEKIIRSFLIDQGYKIENPTNPGHDFIMDGKKIELKFGLATDKNSNWRTIFNHIGLEKDWEEIIFACVNGDCQIRMVKIAKENLPTKLLSHQQGGNKSENDDYMINGVKARQILFETENVEVIA